MEDKNVRDFNDVLIFIITVFFSFCFSLMYIEWQNYHNQQTDRYLNGYAYVTGFSSVDAYVKLTDPDVLAVQSTGNIQYSDNYMMSQNYRYHDSFKNTEKTSQKDNQYYRLSIYDVNDTSNQPIEVDLFKFVPELKKGKEISNLKAKLYEENQKAYVLVTFEGTKVGQNREPAYTFEVSKDDKTLKSISNFSDASLYDIDTIPKDTIPKQEQNVKGYLPQTIGIIHNLGSNLLSNVHALDSGRVAISVGAFDGTSRTIYDQNPKLLEMAKNDSYQLVVTDSFCNDQAKTQSLLDLYKEDGKTSFVDGLVAKADTTIDGQEHLLSNFQDFDRWIYRNVSLTRKEFKSREDVQAILYDPNSTLLPIGVNALDNSLVTYDLASGPLYSFYTYSIGSETSKLKKSIELIQNWRAGFKYNEVVKELYYEQYYRSDYSPYIERIDTANANQEPKQILFMQESIFELLQSNPFENAMKEGKDAFNRIINEGAPVGLYSILDAPRDAIDNGSFNISPDMVRRGYLLGTTPSNQAKEKYGINEFEGPRTQAVSNSMSFVQNGKAITVIIPREEE